MSTMTTLIEESPSTPQIHSSLSSLSPSQTSRSPNIARTYKQASQLFVTRRVKEAFEIIEPLLEPANQDDDDEAERQGLQDGEGDTHATEAPIATATRGARIKVWRLYLGLLNAVVELGPEDGRVTFGARWKELVARTRSDAVWEQIVQTGYAGDEGRVDANVVADIATLLLAHAPSQKATQQRLETYLATSGASTLDVVSHLEQKKTPTQGHTDGTNTPRDLASRLKILEIYTLYVLPKNQEWEYAREFISMSDVIDDERRDAFLQALQSIQDESNFDSKREEQLQRERDQQLEAARERDAEARRREQAETERSRDSSGPNGKPQTSEGGRGIDRLGSRESSKPVSGVGPGKLPPSQPSTVRPSPIARPLRSGPPKAPTRRAPSLYLRASRVVDGLQRSVMSMGQNMKMQPMLILRFLAFLIGLIMAFSRRDIRERLSRLGGESWDKIRRTVGMGVKVSYI